MHPSPRSVWSLFRPFFILRRGALLGTTAKADSRVNWNAGFIRQAGEWHWGCRMNPAFRWWCQDAPVPFHNDRTVAVRKTWERDAGATAPPSGRRTCDTIVVQNPLISFEHPSNTLRNSFETPSEHRETAWLATPLECAVGATSPIHSPPISLAPRLCQPSPGPAEPP